jgi:hypothetical protein
VQIHGSQAASEPCSKQLYPVVHDVGLLSTLPASLHDVRTFPSQLPLPPTQMSRAQVPFWQFRSSGQSESLRQLTQ